MGGLDRAMGQMDAFREALSSCELSDLGCNGAFFTWNNGQEGSHFIQARLDRVVANAKWCTIFPEVSIATVTVLNSDHVPILINNGGRGPYGGRFKKFKYEAQWAKEQGAKDVVKRVWRKKFSYADKWQNMKGKLKDCSRGLLRWGRKDMGEAEKVIEQKTKQLESLQCERTVPEMEKIKDLQKELQLLLAKEEIKWKQKSKVAWLKEGDKNTKYFHACATQRKFKNAIDNIIDEQGRVWESKEEVERVFVDYYKNLFTSEAQIDPAICLDELECRVSNEMNEVLMHNFSIDEVATALKQMSPHKAPGPDGFSAGFYQDNWNVVGEEVCQSVLAILNSGVVDSELNFTYIALIPKTTNPIRVTEFRPISLCNVFYKLISKVIANRLKRVLHYLISKNQSAFIPGRLITDNILAAYETLHTMHTRMWGKEGYMAIKLDMSKAYDRVEWDFLEAILRRLGFLEKWINLIMMCVRTANYAVLVNGNPVGHIYPSRRLRQGDPISPYLFLFCVEALSSLLVKAERTGFIEGAPTSRNGPRINHLFFPDDSLLFCRADLRHWHRVTEVLSTYERASRQRLNREKTAIFFSRNTKPQVKRRILETAGVPDSQRFDTYLGLPALVGKSKLAEFQGIKTRVWKKLQDWKLKFLSQAGKEILIKAVIQAIPTYSMSVFLLPKILCNDLNSLMQRFWWGHQSNENRIHWMCWEKLGVAKSRGGMGFRDLNVFNQALLAKQCWRLWTSPDSLTAQIFKSKYYPNCSILEAQLGGKPSFAWRSIQGASKIVSDGLIWRIGTGSKVRIWGDKWLNTPSTYKVQSPVKGLDETAKVEELIDHDRKGWNLQLIEEIFIEDDQRAIKGAPVSSSNQPDKLVWRGTKNGVFSVSSAYHMVKEMEIETQPESSNKRGQNELWKGIWNMRSPNVVKNFMWRACKNILPTKENLMKKKITEESLCPICMLEVETTFHALWDCLASRDVWGASLRIFQKSSLSGSDFNQVAVTFLEKGGVEIFRMFSEIARRIWLRRNG
jgi:hypothetical protein